MTIHRAGNNQYYYIYLASSFFLQSAKQRSASIEKIDAKKNHVSLIHSIQHKVRISVTKLPLIREISSEHVRFITFIRPDRDGPVQFLRVFYEQKIPKIDCKDLRAIINSIEFKTFRRRNQRNPRLIYDIRFDSQTCDRSHDIFSLIKALNSALYDCEDIHNMLCA